MSAKKQIIIVCMVFIVTAICIVFVISSNSRLTKENSLDEAQKYFEMTDYDNAIAIYNAVLRNERNRTDAYLGLAEAYLAKGNEIKAIEILERGMDYAGNDSRIFARLSELTGGEYHADAEDNFPYIDITSETTLPDIQNAEETAIIPGSGAVITEISSETDAAVIKSETTATESFVSETTTVTITAVQEEKPPAVTTVTTTVPAVVTTTTVTTTTTAAALVEVPDFTGMSKNDAVSLANSLKINLELEYIENTSYENDIIYDQSRQKGEQIAEQASVTVYVSVNNQPTEEELNVQAFLNAAKEWGELTNNNNKIRSVDLNEKNATATVNLSSIKTFTVDSSVMEAFAKCKNAVLVINASAVSMTIRSSSVTKAGKINLSTEVYGNKTRTSIEIGNSSSLNCTVTVTVLDCDISSDDLEKMSLYFNNKSFDKVSVDAGGNPVMTITSGGQYLIR